MLGRLRRWLLRTSWQEVSAFVATVVTIGGAIFFLIDRFAPPPDGRPEPSPSVTAPSVTASPETTAHPRCAEGAICLWPERGFAGKVWVWSAGVSPEGGIPDYLKDHVGSFDARTVACFVDTETGTRRPVAYGDWSRKYIDIGRFGRVLDRIETRC